MRKVRLALLALCAGGAALAQSEGNNDPRAPEAKAPPITYRSAFDEYRPYREQNLASWRDINDEVARVGGHVGLMKHAEQAKKPQPEPAAGGHRQEMHR